MSGQTRQPYLPGDLVGAAPDPLAAAFWTPGEHGELRLQRCTACGRFRHPPLLGCPGCGSPDTEWAPVSGRGTVFSYTIATHPVSPQLADYCPYNVVLVELEEAPDVRIISNIVDTAPEEIAIGMPVILAWDRVSEEVSLPRFRRAES